jgi:ubiquitin
MLSSSKSFRKKIEAEKQDLKRKSVKIERVTQQHQKPYSQRFVAEGAASHFSVCYPLFS